MKRRVIIFLLLLLFLTNPGGICSLAQESKPQEASQTTEPDESLQTIEPEMLWLWGEVVSVDLNTKQMVVKYFDYETDMEKEMSLNIDDKTTFENIKSLDQIKPQDTASIDYVVDANGQNTARNINIERSENAQAAPEEPGPIPAQQ